MSFNRAQSFREFIETDNSESLIQLLENHSDHDFPSINELTHAVEFGSHQILSYLIDNKSEIISTIPDLLWLAQFNEHEDARNLMIEFYLKDYPLLMALRKKDATIERQGSTPYDRNAYIYSLALPEHHSCSAKLLTGLDLTGQLEIDYTSESKIRFQKFHNQLKTYLTTMLNSGLTEDRLKEFITVYNKGRIPEKRLLLVGNQLFVLNQLIKMHLTLLSINYLKNLTKQIEAMPEHASSTLLLDFLNKIDSQVSSHPSIEEHEVFQINNRRYMRILKILQIAVKAKAKWLIALYHTARPIYKAYSDNFEQRRRIASEILGASIEYLLKLPKTDSTIEYIFDDDYISVFCNDMISFSAGCKEENQCYKALSKLFSILKKKAHQMIEQKAKIIANLPPQEEDNTPEEPITIEIDKFLSELHAILETSNFATGDRQRIAATRLVSILLAFFPMFKQHIQFVFSEYVDEEEEREHYLLGFEKNLKTLAERFKERDKLFQRLKGQTFELMAEQLLTQRDQIKNLETNVERLQSKASTSATLSTHPTSIYGNTSAVSTSSTSRDNQLRGIKRPRSNSQ